MAESANPVITSASAAIESGTGASRRRSSQRRLPDVLLETTIANQIV